MARNSAKNHTQPEQAIPVGDPSGKARRMSSGNVVRRAAWRIEAKAAAAPGGETHKAGDKIARDLAALGQAIRRVTRRFTLAGFLV